jgi:hypothetical protein
MAKRNRQTSKKRDREMAKKQRRQDKAQRIAARKVENASGDGPGGQSPSGF